MTPRRRAATMDQFTAITWREPVHWWKGTLRPTTMPMLPHRAHPLACTADGSGSCAVRPVRPVGCKVFVARFIILLHLAPYCACSR